MKKKSLKQKFKLSILITKIYEEKLCFLAQFVVVSSFYFNFSNNSSATNSEDAGFCPVINKPSSTA